MSAGHHNGYQIDDLLVAAADLTAHVGGLQIAVSWTGNYEATVQYGNVPTVEYVIQGHVPIHGVHPVPTVAVALANAIQTCLGNPADAQIQALITIIHNCPVT